jgi:PKD repeat protein
MKSIWLASVAVCLFLLVTCSKNAGVNNTNNENRTIPAMLFNPGGSPAVHAKVRFFPINYNPRSGGLTKKAAASDSATTDSTGNYVVKLDTGTYNVLASGDSGVVYQESITVTKDSAIHPPADTLKTPGGLSGRVRLQPGDDARTVFVLFMGTNIWGTPDDTTGKFTVTNMAQGNYRVRILTTLDAYVPKDTVLSVASGTVDSLAHDIVLQFTGVPGPTGLTVSYDTLKQTVILKWTGADTSLIAGYNVYQAVKGQNFSLITQTPLPATMTTYRDPTVAIGNTYEYEVVSRRASGDESAKMIIPGDTAKAVSSSLVTTTFTWNLNNAVNDSASINDTIRACLAYSNPTRKIEKVVWYADSLNSPVVKQKGDSLLAGKDTLTCSWNQAGNKKILVKVTDGAGTVWQDSLNVAVVQDIPVPHAGPDTTVAINAGIPFRGTATQQFGTIVMYKWDFDGDGTYDDSSTTTGAAAHTYTHEAIYNAKLLVRDDDGNEAAAIRHVTIVNLAPVISSIRRDTTISINDSIQLTGAARDLDGTIKEYAWDFNGDGTFENTSATQIIAGYRYNTAGTYKAVLRVTDDDNKVTKDTATIIVLQDVPVVKFLSSDTVVDRSGTVRCSVYVQQQFGTMTVGIDTANRGNYKSLGSLGLSGSGAYAFSTGNACAWDSVKVRVTDDDGNVVVKGFRVRVRPQPLAITSIDSTASTVTVHYSQSQETDFAEYGIFRNATSSVDTSSELWATVTTAGTVSYTTPSYAWEPRYYRVYQKDSEGVWSAGSNIVYGSIVNSPPPVPAIKFPVHDGDSIWPSSPMRWTKCTDVNGQAVKYRIMINHNNLGYTQLATDVQDTSIPLQGFDMLGYKFKVIAYDSVGDSSGWSGERIFFIKGIFPSNVGVVAIAIDSQDNKWFGTNGGGVSKFDGSTWTTYTTLNGLVGNSVYAIAVDGQGNKWFGTNNGISKFDGTTWTTYKGPNNMANMVSSIAIARQGIEWFGTSADGVFEFDGAKWTTYETMDGLADVGVNAVAIDSQSNKWFGTHSGVSMFDGTAWTTYTTDNGLATNSVNAIAIDGQGNKWFGFGTYGGGVSRFDGSAWTTYTTTNGLANNDVFAIAIDGQGTKWFATSSGVSKLEGAAWSTYTTADGLSNNNVSSVAIDKQGNKWFGINNLAGSSVSKFDGVAWTAYK